MGVTPSHRGCCREVGAGVRGPGGQELRNRPCHPHGTEPPPEAQPVPSAASPGLPGLLCLAPHSSDVVKKLTGYPKPSCTRQPQLFIFCKGLWLVSPLSTPDHVAIPCSPRVCPTPGEAHVLVPPEPRMDCAPCRACEMSGEQTNR